VPDCVPPVPETLGGSGLSTCQLVRAQNRATMDRGLTAGGFSGLVAGVVLAAFGTAIEPRQPTADEAEALVEAYRARAAPVPAPAPGGGGGASLRLEAGPRAARVALRIGF
jgi:anthranilate phosphoribosyltransferase